MINTDKDLKNFSSGMFFDNLNNDKKVDEKSHGKLIRSISFLIDLIFNRIEKICVFLWSEYLNEEDAARLLRLPDPKGKGKETIRNYALRSRKLSYSKAGRDGLLLNRKDLKNLCDNLRIQSVRDL